MSISDPLKVVRVKMRGGVHMKQNIEKTLKYLCKLYFD